MTLDLDALEKLAREATPGPWKDWNGHVWPALYHSILVDKQYIAAFNPQAALALIGELRRARRLLASIYARYNTDLHNDIHDFLTQRTDGEPRP